MDKNDVIQLGEEAGIIPIQSFSMTNLENFAALIENKLHQTYEERLHAVEAIQREKLVCDELVLEHPGRADLTAKQCAFAIRKRNPL